MKKLRALLRLVRGELGDARLPRARTPASATPRRELAGVRDADVMLATLGDLEERYGELPGAAGRLRQALVAHRFRTSAGSAASRRPSGRGDARPTRARGWPTGRSTPTASRPSRTAWSASYRQGRRDFRAARSCPTPSACTSGASGRRTSGTTCPLLQERWKPVMTALADEAHELSDRLGDDHDLAVLLAWAHEHASALDGRDPMLRGFDVIVESRRGGAAGGGVRATARGCTPTSRACSCAGSSAGGGRRRACAGQSTRTASVPTRRFGFR